MEKKFLSVKNLEKYHPGYKDRKLIWCKTYFTMMNADPEFEMLCEIDKWRFVSFVMLELQTQKPVLIDENYLERKGFDFKKRKLSLTLDMLQNFTQAISEPLQNRNVYKEEVEVYKEDKEKEKKHKYMDFVLLTEKEHVLLIEKFGLDGCSKRIAALDDYIASKGAKYASHYRTILVWAKKDSEVTKAAPVPQFLKCSKCGSGSVFMDSLCVKCYNKGAE